MLAMVACLFAANLAGGQERDAASDSYWVGLQAAPTDDALKSHLKVDSGLLVLHVVDDAPAAKSGVKVHDVLLKYNDTKLARVADLSQAIAESKDGEASLELIRAGQQQTLKLTPEQRPAGQLGIPLGDFDRDLGPLADEDRVLRWLRRFDPEKGPMKFHFPRPGIALPEGTKLPQGVSISIQKEGDGPAKITVKRDGESWEVTEETIDELPEDLRPAVKSMLNRGGAADAGRWLKRFMDKDGKGVDFNFELGDPRAIQEQLEAMRRFHEKMAKDAPFEKMREQIEELKKKFEELQKGDQDSSGDSDFDA